MTGDMTAQTTMRQTRGHTRGHTGASDPGRNRRPGTSVDRARSTARALGVLVLACAWASALGDVGDGNLGRDVVSRVAGANTIITVRGSSTPSFTAYRLEQP